VPLTRIANQGLGRLENDTREPDCIVSNSLVDLMHPENVCIQNILLFVSPGAATSSWKIQKITDETKLENKYLSSTGGNEHERFDSKCSLFMKYAKEGRIATKKAADS
jgi:hypothetical protein